MAQMTHTMVLVEDKKTGECKMIGIPNTHPIVEYGAMMDSKTITHMIRKYVARNDLLDSRESWHFINWCFAWSRLSKLKQKTSKLSIVWRQFDDENKMKATMKAITSNVAPKNMVYYDDNKVFDPQF